MTLSVCERWKGEGEAMFSVVIPVYNGARFIDEAVKSVLSQDFADWELIIVNDGSTDNTAQVLETYKDDPRITVHNRENGGVSAARNTGVSLASCEHIAFLDADDVWLKNHLSVLDGMIKQYPDAGLYASFARIHLPDGRVECECPYFADKPECICLDDFLGAYAADKSAKMFQMATTCVKKSAFYKVGGFPVGCKIGEDLALSLHIAAFYPVALTGRATAVYRKVNSTATKDVSFDPDWVFFDRAEEIYADATISDGRKQSLRNLMQWFTMRRCRHYLIEGRRAEAGAAYRAMDKACVSRKDRYLTAALFVLPTGIVQKLFKVRWRTQA